MLCESLADTVLIGRIYYLGWLSKCWWEHTHESRAEQIMKQWIIIWYALVRFRMFARETILRGKYFTLMCDHQVLEINAVLPSCSLPTCVHTQLWHAGLSMQTKPLVLESHVCPSPPSPKLCFLLIRVPVKKPTLWTFADSSHKKRPSTSTVKD